MGQDRIAALLLQLRRASYRLGRFAFAGMLDARRGVQPGKLTDPEFESDCDAFVKFSQLLASVSMWSRM